MSDEKMSVLLLNSKNNEILACKDLSDVSRIITKDDESLLYSEIAKLISENNNISDSSEDVISSATVFKNEDQLRHSIKKVVEIENEKYFINIENIKDTDWLLISYSNLNIIYKEINKMLTYIVITSIIGMLLMQAFLIFIVIKLLKPLKALIKGIENMSKGDFTKDFEVKGNNEISEVGNSLNIFTEIMREIISKLNNVSNRLLESSNNSNSQSEELMNASENQAASMQEMNATVEEMARASGEIADNVSSLANIVSDTYKLGELINSNMNEAVNVSKKGRNDMEELNISMSEVGKSIISLKDTVINVDSQAAKIVDIVKIIEDIASQTNLLSLNATIEAARAGEAGAGFAVVAGEIRSLADKCKKSAYEISEIVNNMAEVTKMTNSKTEQTVKSIAESESVIKYTEETFKEIYEKINKASSDVEKITENIRDVNDIATSVAAITEEQSAANEEISATTETLASGAENLMQNSITVESTSKELKEIVEGIKREVNRFKI